MGKIGYIVSLEIEQNIFYIEIDFFAIHSIFKIDNDEFLVTYNYSKTRMCSDQK